MNINPGVAVTFGTKNLDELSNFMVNELLTAILKAVEAVGAPKLTEGKQGVSCCLFFAFL
jgi:hypothetical protein